jgi:hypothetical protein
MRRTILVAVAMLFASTLCALSPTGLTSPQRILLHYSAQPSLPAISLAISLSDATGRIEYIKLTVGECEIEVPSRYYQDIKMPYLAEAGLHFGHDVEDGIQVIEIEFGAFLPNKNGIPILQKAIIEVKQERVIKREFQMQENGSLWYEEW